MPVSYKQARDIIEDSDLSYKIVSLDSGISPEVLTKIKNDNYISLYSLERLANYLSKIVGKKLQPSDLCEFI
jgi:hypothetical protein